MQTVTVIPSGEALGADIAGVDLSQPLDAATVAAIMDAWHDHLVLRFRGQTLSDDELLAFSRHFGALDLAPITASGERALPAYPEINVISNVIEDGRPIGGLGAGEAVWHTDMSYVEEPPKMSCLFALEVPPEGGDTSFLNMYAAYEALPDDLRARIRDLTCKHDASRNSAGYMRKGFEEVTDVREIPGAVHPLVIAHPETGRPALYLGRRPSAYLMGLPVAESEALLDALWEHTLNPAFAWTQVWRPGDLVMWDNRCTMHRRDAFDPQSRRIMHRTQVQGGIVTAAA